MITPVAINAAIAKVKREKVAKTLSVDKGLSLRITAKGTALWCGKIKYNNKIYNTSFGHFPEIPLIEARRKKEDWEQQIKGGTAIKSYTVEQAFNDWWERKKNTISSRDLYLKAQLHILPILGQYQLKDLTAYQVITHWQYLEKAGKFVTLKHLCGILSQIAIFVQNTGRVEDMHDLTHIQANYTRHTKVKHRTAVAPEQLTELFYQIEMKLNCSTKVFAALMTVFYTLSRETEVVSMRWEWVDFENDVIHFPAEIMKKRRPHDVPISSQLKTLLLSLERKNDFVFYSLKSKSGHLYKTSLYIALFEAGLHNTQTIHGIRSIGSSWFAEQDISEEVAEACLAHASGSVTRRAYQRSELLEKRRPVMQAWCDYVEQCLKKAIDKVTSSKE